MSSPSNNPAPHPAVENGARAIQKTIDRFLVYLERQGYDSHDPYDLWSTGYGLRGRAVYYRNSLLGLPLIAPILLAEILCPQIRALFVRKQRYATADGQFALAFLNLYQITGEQSYLEKADGIAKDLIEYSVPGYSGYCWGYPFDWQHNRGLWKKNTPFITATPYCFEAYLKLYDLTGNEGFFATAKSIADFVRRDLHETPTSADAAAGSYSPIDHSKVINASAYRAMVLFEAADRFGQPESLASARRNLNFILQSQQPDGSWLYALDQPSEHFIDHFHTCFVLKNLVKLNRRLGNGAVAQAIRKGFDYYQKALFGSDGLPRSFAIKPRTQIVRLEMYDFAEAITLGALLREDIPEAFALAQRLAGVICQRYQLRDGHFVTRVYVGGVKHTLSYHRWPQSQLFYALTNLLAAMPRHTAMDSGAASNFAAKK